MRNRDLVVKTKNQKYYLIVVNDNFGFFTSDYMAYDIIDISELLDYFVLHSVPGKIDLLGHRYLHLRKIKRRMIETQHLLSFDKSTKNK